MTGTECHHCHPARWACRCGERRMSAAETRVDNDDEPVDAILKGWTLYELVGFRERAVRDAGEAIGLKDAAEAALAKAVAEANAAILKVAEASAAAARAADRVRRRERSVKQYSERLRQLQARLGAVG